MLIIFTSKWRKIYTCFTSLCLWERGRGQFLTRPNRNEKLLSQKQSSNTPTTSADPRGTASLFSRGIVPTIMHLLLGLTATDITKRWAQMKSTGCRDLPAYIYKAISGNNTGKQVHGHLPCMSACTEKRKIFASLQCMHRCDGQMCLSAYWSLISCCSMLAAHPVDFRLFTAVSGIETVRN